MHIRTTQDPSNDQHFSAVPAQSPGSLNHVADPNAPPSNDENEEYGPTNFHPEFRSYSKRVSTQKVISSPLEPSYSERFPAQVFSSNPQPNSHQSQLQHQAPSRPHQHKRIGSPHGLNFSHYQAPLNHSTASGHTASKVTLETNVNDEEQLVFSDSSNSVNRESKYSNKSRPPMPPGDSMGRGVNISSITSIETPMMPANPKNRTARYSAGYFSKPPRKGSFSPEPRTNLNDEIPPVPPLPEELFMGKHVIHPTGKKDKGNYRMSMHIPSATTTRHVNNRKSIGSDLARKIDSFQDNKYPVFSIDDPGFSPSKQTHPDTSISFRQTNSPHTQPSHLPSVQTEPQSPRSREPSLNSKAPSHMPASQPLINESYPEFPNPQNSRQSIGSFHAFSDPSDKFLSQPHGEISSTAEASQTIETTLAAGPSAPYISASHTKESNSNMQSSIATGFYQSNNFGNNPFSDLILDDAHSLPKVPFATRPRNNSSPSATNFVPPINTAIAATTATARKSSIASVNSTSNPTQSTQSTRPLSTQSPNSRKSSITNILSDNSSQPSSLRKSSITGTAHTVSTPTSFTDRSRNSSASVKITTSPVVPTLPSAISASTAASPQGFQSILSRNSIASMVSGDSSVLHGMPHGLSHHASVNSSPKSIPSVPSIPVAHSRGSSSLNDTDASVLPLPLSKTSSFNSTDEALVSTPSLAKLVNVTSAPMTDFSAFNSLDADAMQTSSQLVKSQTMTNLSTTPVSASSTTPSTPVAGGQSSAKRLNLSSLAKSPYRPLNRPAHVYPQSNKKAVVDEDMDKANSVKIRSKSTVAKQWNNISTSLSSSSKRLLLSPFSSEFRRASQAEKAQNPSSTARTDMPPRRPLPAEPHMPLTMPDKEEISDYQAEIQNIMKHLVKTMPDEERIMKRYEEAKKNGLIKDPVTPSLAARTQRLNMYERGEILDYRNVFFCGRPDIKKISGDIRHATNNYGFDDSNGDYQVVPGDHIAYRYEILGVLGKGSFGKVLKCIDHKNGKLVAVKLIINRKRFHMQALVEADILRTLSQWVS